MPERKDGKIYKKADKFRDGLNYFIQNMIKKSFIPLKN
jgi:hypothetical protein